MKLDQLNALATKFNKIPTTNTSKRLQLLCLIIQAMNIEAVRKNDTSNLLFTDVFKKEAATNEAEILTAAETQQSCRKIEEIFDPNAIDVSLVNLTISDQFSDDRCYLNLGLPTRA